MLREQLIAASGVALEDATGARVRLAGVAERDERVAAQPARVVARNVEPVVPFTERCAVRFQPVDEADVRGWIGFEARPAALHAAVPGADILADVAAVHLR